jgi:hypothetical protein
VKAKHGSLLGLAAMLAVLAAAGCSHNPESPAVASTDPIVFDDDFGDAVDYQAFMDSKLDAVQMDFSVAFNGPASLRVTVPGPGATDGTFAGGAFTTSSRRDLTQYNAISFYVKSSVDATLNIAGTGNDNTGTSLYQSSENDIPMTTDWTHVIIPIPNPSRLDDEGGLFFFAEGYEDDAGYDFWMDEIRFVSTEGITDPRPVMDTRTESTFVGGSVEITGTAVTFDLGRDDVYIDCFPACFDYFSTDDGIATVEDGTIEAVGSGDATITAKLDTVDADGAVTINVMGAPDGPAPEPTVAESGVISLFCDVYDNVPVNTWHAFWTGSTGEVRDMVLHGDNVKVYTDLNFAGVEFVGDNLIDAATPGMTHFHMDVWAPSGGLFKVKLVDFGANEQYDGGGDDTNGELTLNGGTTPPFFSGQWSPLEIPLSDFTAVGLTDTPEHLANLVISSSDVHTVIVDNVYFHR